MPRFAASVRTLIWTGGRKISSNNHTKTYILPSIAMLGTGNPALIRSYLYESTEADRVWLRLCTSAEPPSNRRDVRPST